MATNKQDDKALAEDQAFIQSLYDDLSDQNGDDATEQPSEQLDQSILAAAHKAVAAKPSLHKDETSSLKTGDNVQELNHPANKRKKMAWYYPAATAASVLLVGIIVNHQLSGPINPIYEAPLASMDHITKFEQSESLVASVAEMEEEMFIAESDDAFADSELPLIASVEVPVSRNKKAMKSRAIGQEFKAEITSEPIVRAAKQSTEAESVIATAKPQASFAAKKETKADMLASNDLTTATQKQMLVEQAQQKRRLAEKAKRETSVKDRLLSKQKSNSPLSPTVLSYEKYKALQAQSKQKTLYWLLQQESDSSYVIELFLTEQTSLFYRLNKNSFQLNKSSGDKEKPFAEITYIEEK